MEDKKTLNTTAEKTCEKLKVKGATIARLVALAVALANQCLALFGTALPFTGELAYQLVTFGFTAVTVAINAWYNNDITPAALIAGKLFNALKDGKITPEEVDDLLAETEKNA